jgi:hypothetical protein
MCFANGEWEPIEELVSTDESANGLQPILLLEVEPIGNGGDLPSSGRTCN